ncbi:hypothetical protein [Thermococcus nautili]|uniref:Uncharacterized protein n=1 Tax=Thermococcus nautili TaxID=195522 RepID=W8P521_9EURY|nr:hypothetical protein [Thermococcus nautili]AHL22560.1 hypothetical protein BD01_0941 [Thermococcus nautili]
MKKLVAVLFGLLVVATGLVAATTWAVTSVHKTSTGEYGWALAEVGVKYDVQHPYTNYQITYRYGNGGLTEKGKEKGYTYFHYNKYPDRDSITSITVVLSGATEVEEDIATAGWPYI